MDPDAFIIFFSACSARQTRFGGVASVNHSRLTWRLLMPRTNEIFQGAKGLDGGGFIGVVDEI